MTIIEEAKRLAPTIPENTCPIIDNIQSEIESLITDRRSKMEDIRHANELLREGGVYWYDIAKEMQDRINILESEMEELQDRINILESEMEELEKENGILRQQLEEQHA